MLCSVLGLPNPRDPHAFTLSRPAAHAKEPRTKARTTAAFLKRTEWPEE